MRYDKYEFEDSYSNASGRSKKNMALGELSKLLATDRQAVITAVRDADVDLSRGADVKEILETIKENGGNRKMMTHISLMVMENANFSGADGVPTKGGWLKGLGGKIGGLFKRKTNADGTKKDGFFKGLFKRGTNADGTKGSSKFGSWFNNNKEAIGGIGNSILGGLFSKGGTQQVESGTNYYQGNPNGGGGGGGGNKPSMSMGAKIGIGVGILGVLGLVIFLVRRK